MPRIPRTRKILVDYDNIVLLQAQGKSGYYISKLLKLPNSLVKRIKDGKVVRKRHEN